jgi:hypothetical protein
VIYAIYKEAIYDPMNENAITRGSDLVDFIFLLLGSLLAGGIVWIHGR